MTSLMEKQAQQVMIIAHAGQTRFDGRPYEVHPEKVVAILKQFGVTRPEMLAAAYLHDVLEDTTYSPENLRTRFGDEVFGLVKELTHAHQELTDTEYFENCFAMSPDARIIKVADILANLTDKGRKSEHFVDKRVKALTILLSGRTYGVS